MIRASVVVAVALVSLPVWADSTLRLTTDVAELPAKTTEAQCLDKAKAAIAAAKLTVGDAPHAKTGTAEDMVVMVDCMQSWNANVAHISAAYVTTTKPATVDAVVAAIKAALRKKPG